MSINFSFSTIISLVVNKTRHRNFLSSLKLPSDMTITARTRGVLSEDRIKELKHNYALIESHILISFLQFRISSLELHLTPDEGYSQGEVCLLLYKLSQVEYYA